MSAERIRCDTLGRPCLAPHDVEAPTERSRNLSTGRRSGSAVLSAAQRAPQSTQQRRHGGRARTRGVPALGRTAAEQRVMPARQQRQCRARQPQATGAKTALPPSFEHLGCRRCLGGWWRRLRRRPPLPRGCAAAAYGRISSWCRCRSCSSPPDEQRTALLLNLLHVGSLLISLGAGASFESVQQL